MNPWFMALSGFAAGMAFGLLVAWGVVGMLVAGLGAAVLVVGVFLPTMYKPWFSLALVGFVAAYVAAGGLSLL